MLEQIAAWNGWLNGLVWGWPTIVLLLGTGVVLTVLTGGVQFRYLGFASRGARQDHAEERRSWQRLAVPGRRDRARLHRRRRQHRGRGDRHRHRRPRRAVLAVGLGRAGHVHEVRGDRDRAALPRTRRQRRHARRRDVHAEEAWACRGSAPSSRVSSRWRPSASATWSRPIRSPTACAPPSASPRADRHRARRRHRRGHPRRHPAHRRGDRDPRPGHGPVLSGRRSGHPDAVRRARFPTASAWCSTAPSRARRRQAASPARP